MVTVGPPVSICRRSPSRAFAAVLALAAVAAGPQAAAAGAGKTLRIGFAIAETSFDPAFASDAASDAVIDNVIESMVDYDYLARPVKLVPRTLEALPTVEDGGRTYVCRLRKGILFTPDPAFKGVARELTAADYAYSFKRHLDPAQRSPWAWLLEGKLVGGDEAQAAAKQSGRFDYDAPLPGLEVVQPGHRACGALRQPRPRLAREDDDFVARGLQSRAQGLAEEARTTGDEYSHRGHPR